MSFNSQSNSRRSNSRQFSRSAHDKKSRSKKKHTTAKYLQEETPQQTPQEAAERAQNAITKLGEQIFALSPFSQYFDDWIVNLRHVASEFESNPSIAVDEEFQKESAQAFSDIEATLAERRLNESNLSAEEKALENNNHLIAEADREYAEKTRENSNRRNSDVQRLSNKIRQLENDLAAEKEIKISFYKINEKKRNQQRINQLNEDLSSSKNELEVTLASFGAEQEKMHDNFEKRKQELHETSDRLRKELEKLETDTSMEDRKAVCSVLTNAIKSLLERTPIGQSDTE